jgi:hypothetical protein
MCNQFRRRPPGRPRRRTHADSGRVGELNWNLLINCVLDGTPAPLRAKRDERIPGTAADQRDVVHLLETTGAPLLRLLAVFDGGIR